MRGRYSPNTFLPSFSPRRLTSLGSSVLRNFLANLRNFCCWRSAIQLAGRFFVSFVEQLST
jgi:hypothetical protein